MDSDSILDNSEAGSDFADRSPDHFWRPRRFALWLMLLVGILFWDVLTGTRVFVFRDFGLFGYPLAWHHRESFWNLEVPLWNPLSNSGLPFLAQWNTMVFYPLSSIYVFLPMPWSASLFSVVHLLIAGMGMYLLCREFCGDQFASFLAGTAYAFNGLVLNCLMWPNNIAALAWMPWVAWQVRKAYHEGGKRVYVAALVGATQMLSGAPEVIIFTWAIMSCLVLVEAWNEGRGGFQVLGRFILIVGIVALLSAVQLLPFIDLLRHSHRTATSSYESAMPGWGWANLLTPPFHCYRSPAGVYFQRGQFWTSSYYAGIATLLFALSALRARQRWVVSLFWSICLLSLIMALGNDGFLYKWLRMGFPAMGVMNFPIKFVVPVCFLLPLLAGMGVSSFRQTRLNSLPTSRLVWPVLGTGLCALVVALLWFSWKFPLELGEWETMRTNTLVRISFLILGACAIHAWGRENSPARKLALEAVMVAVVFGDQVTHLPWQNPTAAPGIYEHDLQPLRKLNPIPKFGADRAMLSEAAIWKFHLTMFDDPFTGYVGPRLALYDNCNLLEEVPKIDGFYSLYLKFERDVGLRLFSSETEVRGPIADFLGVSEFSAKKNPLEWEPRKTFLPLLVGGQKPVFAEDQIALRGVMQPDFEPRKRLYLPLAAQGMVHITNETDVEIRGGRFQAHRIEAEVRAKEDSIVSIAQAFYHPWRAYIDGQKTELWRANYAFQAVVVPAGVHRLTLLYKDYWFYTGAVLSGLGLLLCTWRLRY